MNKVKCQKCVQEQNKGWCNHEKLIEPKPHGTIHERIAAMSLKQRLSKTELQALKNGSYATGIEVYWVNSHNQNFCHCFSTLKGLKKWVNDMIKLEKILQE